MFGNTVIAEAIRSLPRMSRLAVEAISDARDTLGIQVFVLLAARWWCWSTCSPIWCTPGSTYRTRLA
jgi:hypothetical protein